MKLLRYKEDIRPLFFLALYFGLLFYCFFFVPLDWVNTSIALVFLCSLNFMVATIIHNTVHCPVFYNKTLNKIHFVLLSFAFGSPASGYVPGHNLSHHKHVQTAKDNASTYKMRFKWNFLNQLLFFFVMIPGILRAERKFVNEVGKFKPKWYRQYQTEVILMWTFRIILLLMDWQAALVYLIIPNIYAVWGIFGTNFWQHDGCDEKHPFNHSRNFSGKVFNFLVCNNGYHVAHHMHPSMHWSLYPAFHEKEIRPYLHPNLDRNLLFTYIWESCIWPGKRVDYLGRPLVLPPPEQDQDWIHDQPIDELDTRDLGAELG